MRKAQKQLSKAKITDGFVRRGAVVRSTARDYHLVGKVEDITFEHTGGTRIWVSWAGMQPVPMGGTELQLRPRT